MNVADYNPKITMSHSYQWLPTGAGLGPSTATLFPIRSDIINNYMKLYGIKSIINY